jgi:hypothetical protein
VNGDGRQDVFVGGGNGQVSRLYLQQPNGQFSRSSQAAFEEHRASNDVEALFFDANGDDAPDLYVASGGYGGFSENDPALQDRLYLNDGTGSGSSTGSVTFSTAPDALPRMRTSTGAVVAGDVNGDGRPDLFVGGRVIPGRYPEAPRSYVLLNQADGAFADRTAEVAPLLQNPGMVTDAAWQDLNGNGAADLVVAGEWMPIRVFEGSNGTLMETTDTYFDTPQTGFWYSVNVLEMGDGRIGLLAGNLGRNTQIHASEDEPAELWYHDFDNNGEIDPLLSYYIDGKRYPHVLLNRLRETVPSLAARYSSYEAYADATMEDLLTAEERENANRLDVRHLETSLFLVGDDGTLQRQTLPVEAQYAPVYDVHPMDYNADGHTDVLLTGNMNETRIRFPKYDANYGVLLHGDGTGGFSYVPQQHSGFALQGDVRGVLQIEDRLFFGRNRDSVAAYRPETARRARNVPVQAQRAN